MPLFDYSISNPPYQKKTSRKNTVNIFDKFHLISLYCSFSTCFIYPAGRWFYDVKSPLRRYIFSYHLLRQLQFYSSKQSYSVFPTVSIADGLNIIYTTTSNHNSYVMKNNDTKYLTDNWLIDTPLPINASHCELAEKILITTHNLGLPMLSDISSFTRNQAGYSSKQLYDLHLEPYDGRQLKDNEIKIYANATGKISGKSNYYIIDKDLIRTYDHRYQVCCGRSILENSNRKFRTIFLDNTTVFGASSVLLFKSINKYQALNFYRYCQSLFFEYCMRLNIEGRKKVMGTYIPHFYNYCDNGLIDFSGDIDTQLYELFDLTDEEVELVEKCRV